MWKWPTGVVLGQEVEVLSAGRHGVDNDLVAVVEDQDHGFKEAGFRVEAEAQFAPWWVVVERFNPQRPIGSLERIFGKDSVLKGSLMNSHAAKCATAARMASDRLRPF